MNNDWRDGFLFVGNQVSLDFLNTRPVMDANPVELLPDCAALARWLSAAGLVSQPQAKRLERRWSGQPAALRMLGELRVFRERLRMAVLQIEAGGAPSRTFTAEVNELLLAHPHIDQVVRTHVGFERVKRFDPQTPQDVFSPIVDDVASVLTVPDKSRLRKCESCILHFYDTSKKGTRRWCSMNLCGNRSKVAAYASRRRAETSGK